MISLSAKSKQQKPFPFARFLPIMDKEFQGVCTISQSDKCLISVRNYTKYIQHFFTVHRLYEPQQGINTKGSKSLEKK